MMTESDMKCKVRCHKGAVEVSLFGTSAARESSVVPQFEVLTNVVWVGRIVAVCADAPEIAGFVHDVAVFVGCLVLV